MAERDQWVGTRALALRSQGDTWQQVADQLNAEGFYAPRGGILGPSQVSRIVQRLEAQCMENQLMEKQRTEGEDLEVRRFIPISKEEVVERRKTAEQGDATAQSKLGLMYVLGVQTGNMVYTIIREHGLRC